MSGNLTWYYFQYLKWTPHPQEVSVQLETRYQKGLHLDGLEFEINHPYRQFGTLVINLGNWSQRRVNGFQRLPLRRGTATECPMVWEFVRATGERYHHSTYACQLLEYAFEMAKVPTAVETDGVVYHVDVLDMSQQQAGIFTKEKVARVPLQANDHLQAIWQWQNDMYEWQDYAPENSYVLETNYCRFQNYKDSKVCYLDIFLGSNSMPHVFTVDFERLCQLGKCGKKRDVRRCVKQVIKSDDQPRSWQWQWFAGSKGWQAYTEEVELQLERARTRGHQECRVEIAYKVYIVDLHMFKQRPHHSCGSIKERDVRRIEIDPKKSQASHEGRTGQAICILNDQKQQEDSVKETSNSVSTLHQGEGLYELRDVVHPSFSLIDKLFEAPDPLSSTDIHHQAAGIRHADAVNMLARNYAERLHRCEECFHVQGVPEVIMAAMCLAFHHVAQSVGSMKVIPHFHVHGRNSGDFVKVYHEWRDLARAQHQKPHGLPERDAGHGWVRENNSQLARIQRLGCACSTLNYGGLHFISEMPEPRLLRRSRLNPSCSSDGQQRMTLKRSEKHVLDTAFDVQFLRKVAVVNAASAYQVGGGFLTGGRHALEEAICTQSTLWFSLLAACRNADSQNLADSSGRRVHIPEDGIIFSPQIKVFRHGSDMGYKMLNDEHVFNLAAVLSVAMPNKNPHVLPMDSSSGTAYAEKVKHKLEMVLLGARQSEADILIMPDVGCGLFQNDPREVGRLLGQVLKQNCTHRIDVILTGSSEFYEAARECFEGPLDLLD